MSNGERESQFPVRSSPSWVRNNFKGMQGVSEFFRKNFPFSTTAKVDLRRTDKREGEIEVYSRDRVNNEKGSGDVFLVIQKIRLWQSP